MTHRTSFPEDQDIPLSHQTMLLMNRCRLCGSGNELKGSHIIPAFVYRWQKATSSTGCLRFSQQINRRVQDGIKVKFLCAQCEARLSQWETPFKNCFFESFHKNGQATFSYESWMAKCCVSVSWRVLRYLMERGAHPSFDTDFGQDAQEALSVWADFLLDRRQDVDRFEQHLLPLGAIANANVQLPPKIQRYLMRAVEMNCVCNNQSALTFAKLGHVVIVGFVREPQAHLWKGTKVALGRGTITHDRLLLPDWFLVWLFGQANSLTQIEAVISPQQGAKIQCAQRTNPEIVAESETFLAFLEDIRLNSLDRQIDQIVSDNGFGSP